MSIVNCPICKSENSIFADKCENCNEDFSRYDKVGTSKSTELVPPDKISGRKIRRADKEKPPLIIIGFVLYYVVLLVLLGLILGQIICEEWGCLFPGITVFILLFVPLILLFISMGVSYFKR